MIAARRLARLFVMSELNALGNARALRHDVRNGLASVSANVEFLVDQETSDAAVLHETAEAIDALVRQTTADGLVAELGAGALVALVEEQGGIAQVPDDASDRLLWLGLRWIALVDRIDALSIAGGRLEVSFSSADPASQQALVLSARLAGCIVNVASDGAWAQATDTE